MRILTDNPRAVECLIGKQAWAEPAPDDDTILPQELTSALFGEATLPGADSPGDSSWRHLLVAAEAPQSQYDTLIALSRGGLELPDGLACLAVRGDGFHGFKGRSWSSPPGNVYLTVHFAPGRPVPDFGFGFLTLAAVSVVEAIDSIAGLKNQAMIKWVNDILLDRAKVGGVLAHTSTQGECVTSAIMGIGLNVLTTPSVEPTPFVPEVTSLSEHHDASDYTDLLPDVVRHLLDSLARNYRLLLDNGYPALFRKYRARSMVLGCEVAVCVDAADDRVEVIAEGRVTDLNDRLELSIDGHPAPVVSGRLILK